MSTFDNIMRGFVATGAALELAARHRQEQERQRKEREEEELRARAAAELFNDVFHGIFTELPRTRRAPEPVAQVRPLSVRERLQGEHDALQDELLHAAAARNLSSRDPKYRTIERMLDSVQQDINFASFADITAYRTERIQRELRAAKLEILKLGNGY